MTEFISLGRLTGEAEAVFQRSFAGWGLAVRGQGRSSAGQLHPVQAEVWRQENVERYSASYTSVEPSGEALKGRARLELGGEVELVVEDNWRIERGTLHLERDVRVEGSSSGGFLTAITLQPEVMLTWPDVDAFVPGMIYGWNERLAPQAIGNMPHYLAGVRAVRIREDRMPAPLFGLALRDGSSITVLNPDPRGDTTREDSRDLEGAPLVDRRFAFAALGGEEQDGRLTLGLWFPGTEGEVTYLADTPFADGQFGKNARRRWRQRYHPLEHGFAQRYQVAFRFGSNERDQDFRRNSWRWAWQTLKPPVVPQDLELAKRVLSEALESSIQQVENRAGPAHLINVVTGEVHDRPVMMGFTGRAVETGMLLLQDAAQQTGEKARRRRERALAVLETFARLPMSPPRAEGLSLSDGRLTSGVRPDFYLRALGEGGKFMLRAYELELKQGEQPHWLAWCKSLADWLLTQELPDGGFPRAWRDDSAEVVMADPRSSYAVVPFFVQLTRVTGEAAYLQAALRAAELCWALDGSRGYFVGGTLDNANVVDKEAGTLTLEACLVLYAATGDERWLSRAIDAADFAETWIFVWNIPMPEDENEADLHWKPGVTTVGAQLISTGHSLTDAYMAWDVTSYAKLARLTGDEHYQEVARLLLHNTKVMLALPHRTFDLTGPGWQQEHWSFAPPRGRGQHRHWLPWVTCSHLEGLYSLDGLKDCDPELYQRLAKG